MKIMAFTAFILSGAVLAAAPQVVKDSVVLAQDPITRDARITYTLSGAPGIVTLDILTNGVSIGAENFLNLAGDVNRKVEPGARQIIWRKPYVDWASVGGGEFQATAVVTAWATNSPPTYMVIDTETLLPADFRFYPCAEAIPGGITNNIYKTKYLAMRRVYATGVMWRMGTPAAETNTYFKASDSRAQDVPPHLVILTNDYYLGVYELTQKQWQNAYGNSGAGGEKAQPSAFKNVTDADLRPVENIAWKTFRGDGDAGASYNWPSNGHDVDPSYFLGKMRSKTGLMFDLPTSAQWEFACRAGCTLTNNLYGVSIDDLAWHSGNWRDDPVSLLADNGCSNQTHAVGQKLPNAWGFYDMLGNVEEWCLDRKYANNAALAASCNADGTPSIEPQGAIETSGNRARRGGAFIDVSAHSRCGHEIFGWSQAAKNKILGLRLWCPAVVP